ncbi:Nn.00g054580.m01.CDS01 [Neocucurbitaria sp. VM-36]
MAVDHHSKMPRRSKRIATRIRSHTYNYGSCPSRAINNGKHFYTALKAKYRKPIDNDIKSEDSPWSVTPKVITSLKYEAWKWKDAAKPATFCRRWPPSSATELMNVDIKLEDLGTQNEQEEFLEQHGDLIKDDCLGKYCWQNCDWSSEFLCAKDFDARAVCDHTFSEWKQGCAQWQTRFEIRAVSGMGHGLYSKWAWSKGDVLGAYLGELIHAKPKNTDYCHQVKMGPDFSRTRAQVTYVDAEKHGNFARFCNHSCENNAIITEARVGNERVLALRAITDIAVGEQVSIDYGSDYFQERQCLCGKPNCKYPNTTNLVSVVA